MFREFLRSEYSEDNLLFWLACEDLKKETSSGLVDEKARIIYEDYVSILSPKEVPNAKHEHVAPPPPAQWRRWTFSAKSDEKELEQHG